MKHSIKDAILQLLQRFALEAMQWNILENDAYKQVLETQEGSQFFPFDHLINFQYMPIEKAGILIFATCFNLNCYIHWWTVFF